MSSSDFEKDFETILEEILTDTRNQYPGADTSQGSPLFMMAVRLASATWGLHKKQSKIAEQIFPDTAIDLLVDRHAYCAGLSRAAGESTESLAARVLEKKRKPGAGGNKDDYETWATEVDGVAGAHCIPTPRGAGTVDVVVLASAGDNPPVPAQPLLDAVYAHIDELRPVTAGDFTVLAVAVLSPAITMTISGSINADTLAANIKSYCDTLKCKDTLFLSQLVNLALELGANDAVVTAPIANVTATDYQVIRSGVITINV
ncbi:MAG: baseplate J/gp47 family protein [Elusimicrobia bacterium]|nr:baseplate J/gp47 family protein [Elusimicrobiota bacterium]